MLDSTFADLPAPDRTLLRELARTRSEAPGAVLIAVGQEAPGLLVLREGEAVVEVPGNRRDRVRLGPGDLVGEMSFLTGDPASASVVCETACVLDHIPALKLLRAAADQPAFSARLHHRLGLLVAQRLAFQNERHGDDRAGTRALLERLTASWGGALAEIKRIRFTALAAR